MNISSGDSLHAFCKAGFALVAVATLLFLTGLAKDPSPSDEIRSFLVAGLGVTGALLYILGRILSNRRR
ncbi:hypothetical protein ASD77_06705 [Pseudoxanthomonas sp. Root65]|nr:hypothetical protein ASD77_06705 [Pseudoxanthomonas sp. Root65]